MNSYRCHTLLKVLADPIRFGVVRLLLEKPCTVGVLNKALTCPQNLLSHHLKVLRESGLVVSQRDGKCLRYQMAPGTQSNCEAVLDLGCCRLSFND